MFFTKKSHKYLRLLLKKWIQLKSGEIQKIADSENNTKNFLDHEPQRRQEILDLWEKAPPLTLSDIADSVLNLPAQRLPQNFQENLSLLQMEFQAIKNDPALSEEERNERYQATFQAQRRDASRAILEGVIDPTRGPIIEQPNINHLAYFLLTQAISDSTKDSYRDLAHYQGSLIQRALIYSILYLNPAKVE